MDGAPVGDTDGLSDGWADIVGACDGCSEGAAEAEEQRQQCCVCNLANPRQKIEDALDAI